MDSKKVRNYFDLTADLYDSDVISGSLGLRFVNKEETRIVIDSFTINQKDVILDLGVGTGRIALELAKRGVSVVGVDTSKEMIRSAKQKISCSSLKSLNLVLANGEKLPFVDDSFNGVVSIRVLHYMNSWREAISEISRITKTGGQVLLEVNGSFTLSLIARMIGTMKAKVFNPYIFANELNKRGLNVLHFKPFIRMPIFFYTKIKTSLMLKIISMTELSLSFLPSCLLAIRFFTFSRKRA